MRIFVSHDLIATRYFHEFADHLSAAGYSVSDAASVPAGASVRSTVRQLMFESDCYVVLLGRDTCNTPEVNLEIAAARLAARDRPWFRIVPVVLDRSAEFPPLLSGYAQLDGRQSPRQTAVALAEALRHPAPARDTAAEQQQLAICAHSYEASYTRRQRELDRDSRILSRVPAMALLVGAVGLLVGWLSSTLSGDSGRWLAVALVVVAATAVAPIAVFAAAHGRPEQVHGQHGR
jgi:hypothetical protein